MGAALVHLSRSLPPGFDHVGMARLEGMQLVLAWVLAGPLPGDYPNWFEEVVEAWRRHEEEVPAFNE